MYNSPFVVTSLRYALSYKNVRLKNPQNLRTFQEHTELRKGEELICWILHKITKTVSYFSTNVYQGNIAFSVVHVQVCIYFFVIIFLLAGQGSGQFNKVYLCFRLLCTNGK